MGDEPAFVMPAGLAELRDHLEQHDWPARSSALHASGVPLMETPADPAGDAAAGAAAAPASVGDALAAGQAAGAATDGAPAAGDGQQPGAGDTAGGGAAAAPPAFDPADLEAENAYLRTQLGQLGEAVQGLLQQQRGPQQPEPQPGAFDPAQLVDEFGQLNPQALIGMFQQFGEQLMGGIDQRFQQIQAPLAARQEAETVAQGEERLQDILVDDIAHNGDFVRAAGDQPEQVAAAREADQQARALVRTVADQLFPEIAERYGATPRAAEMAMTRAADQVRTLLRAAGAGEAAAQANRLATLAGQRGEPGAGAAGGAGAVEAPVVKVNERVVDRYAAARA